jgi:hypothetical protein
MKRKQAPAKTLRDNALGLVMFGLFAVFLVGQTLAGWRHHNDEQSQHGQSRATLGQYVRSGDFLESVAENWESEFLQMAAFILLSAVLVQRGAGESKKPSGDEHEKDPRRNRRPDSPWPVHRGGLALKLYNHSLSLALGLLFVGAFALHAVSGVRKYNDEAVEHGSAAITVWQYLGSSTFWFESFQNWQSEFLSVGVLIVLSIFLRERGSPESKPVHAPHHQTGS